MQSLRNILLALQSFDSLSVSFRTQLRSYAWRSSGRSVKIISHRISFLIDAEWSRKVLQHVFESLRSSKGSGLLHTIWLPNAGNSTLLREALLMLPEVRAIVWEPHQEYVDYLQAAVAEYPERLTFKQKSFVTNVFLDENPFYVPSVLKQKDDDGIALIGHIPQLQLFLTNLISMVSAREGSDAQLWRPGYVNYFLFAPEIEYKMMTNTIERRSGAEYARYILYNTFYECKLINKIPVSAFNRGISVTKSLQKVNLDTDHVYLVQLSIRSDVFNKVTHPTLLPKLARMIRVLSRKRSQRVIPTLERLCPTVGVQLIELGISMVDEFRNLSLDVWPEIFKIVTNSPGYEFSALKILVDNSSSTRRRHSVSENLSHVRTDLKSSAQVNSAE